MTSIVPPPILALCFSILMTACGSLEAPQPEEAIAIPSQQMAQTDTTTPETETPPEAETPPEEDSPAPPTDSAPASPQTFSLSAQESLLYAQIWKDQSTWFSTFAHDHVIRATAWSGGVSYLPEDPAECDISFSLDVNSFENDEPSMREFVGLEGTLSESDRSTVHEHMLSEGQLNGEVHQTLSFESTACLPSSEGNDTLEVTGNLTLRGETRPVNVLTRFQRADGHLYAQGTFEISHAQFGFEPFSAFFGSIKNGERILIGFDVHGIPDTPAGDAPTSPPAEDTP